MAKKISDLDQLAAEQSADDEDFKGRTQYKPDWRREDRPNYGVLGHDAHEKMYENWRANHRIKDLPSWKELDNSGKAAWMSSSGSSMIAAANRELRKTNFSEQAGRAVQHGAGESRSAETNPTRSAEKRARAGIRGAAAGGEQITASADLNINSPFATTNNYEHHKNLEGVVSKLESAHNGSNGSVTPLAAAARKSISDSIYAQGTGKNEDALKHFTDAAGHTMRLAQAVNGAAHNAGDASSALGAMSEANTHLTNYRNHLAEIKKVNQHV